MELKIYDKQGLVKMTVSPDNSSQWSHEVGVENVVTVNFTTWEFLVLEVGWYILVEGQRFSIKSEYRPKHIHDTKYTYNLKFYGREHDAQDILFCRLNQGEDDLESVFAYDGTPMDFLQKVVANMNRNTDGVVWKAGEAISANRQTINFNGLYCWDALGEIARAFGTEWWMDGEYLNISKCERGESVSLGYGQGLKSGLTQNENTNAVKWFTRLIPVGSSKNIDKNKYGYATLQLPGREKYIDINTQYGLKEYREEAAFSEIYPHRVGTISSVRSEERTNEETGNYTVYYVKDSSLPFNPDEYMIGGEVIHMTFNNGALAGKDFEVNWNNETKEFEIINQYPDENTQLPGGNLVPSADDTYVLWNISMPDEYIRAAEQELKTAVDVYLAEYSKDISVYSGSTDYIYISKNHVPLLLGQRVRLLSEIYFGNIGRDSRITRVSRKLNNLNEATIECGNVVSSSWKSNVSSSINNIAVSQQNTAKKQESQQKEIDKLNVLSELWEVRKDSQGHVFLYTKYDIATQKGITMYAEGGDLDLPSIYAGLPFDNQTIWLNPETGVIEVLGGNGSSGEGGASNFWDLNGIPGWITNTKPTYNYSEIKNTPDLSEYVLNDDLKKYVSLDGNETINGLKNFTKGLQIDGLGISKLQDDVVYLDAHLVVRGGITMYGTGEDVDVPTIMDALSVDGVNLQVINGVLTFVGEASGGVADSVRWENVIGRPTLLSSFTDDVVAGKYLPLNTSTTNILTSSDSGVLNFKSTSRNEVGIRLYFNETNGGGLWYNGVQGMYLYNAASATQLGLLNDGTPYYQDLTYNKRHLWHSGNFNPSNYLPLSGGTISGTETLPITISNNINDGEFQVGIRLLNPNKTNTNGNTNGTAQFGYSKSNGVYMFNYDNYNYYNCAIGITDDGIAYVGKGGSIGTKYKIWHEGNDGSGSGLDADLLDGKHNGELSAIYLTHTDIGNANTFGNLGAVSYCNTISPSLSNIPSDTNSWQQAILSIGLHSTSNLQAQFYMSRGHNLYYRSDRNGGWGKLAFTTDNVASATKLQTARTIWGQSFDGTKDVTGDFKAIGSMIMETGTGWDTSKALTLVNTADNHGRIGLYIYGQAQSNNDNIGGDGRSTIRFYRNYNKQASFTYSYGIQHHIPNDLLLLNNNSGTVISINQSGNVGFRTTSPAYPLHVVGATYLQGYLAVNNYATFEWQTTGANPEYASRIGSFDHKGGFVIQFGKQENSNTKRFEIIDQNWTTALFYVDYNGNVFANGGITMYSDQRKKTILNHVELSLKQIANAPLIEHYYNSDESKTTHVGSIAQYWASLNDWFCKKDNEGFYTMEIQNAALASAISIARELQRYESKTDKKIRLLKKRISELEDEIEKLKTA